MAELPRVEAYRRLIEGHCKGKTIALVQGDSDLLVDISMPQLRAKLLKQKIGAVYRHGKMLFVALGKGKGFLVLHFGPEGYPAPDADPALSPLCVFSLGFHDASFLWIINERRIGEIGWTANKEKLIEERGYGPDALIITEKQFLDNVRKRRSAIKAVLMNQDVTAGIGNAYADEILFRAGLHPHLPMRMITTEMLRKLWQEMRAVLSEAIEGKAEHHFFVLNRKAGQPCPHCHTLTKQKYVQGRSTYFCPSCQP